MTAPTPSFPSVAADAGVETFDLAIVGSGFAGSLLAMMARRLELRVLLVERDSHPRFAIGESSTPLANLLLEELAAQWDLPMLASFSKWGSWRRDHPEIRCGLKRGFSFYRHRPGQTVADVRSSGHELLVAASPNDRIADTHWLRSDLDAFLCGEAQALGAVYREHTEVARAERKGPGWMLELRGPTGAHRATARLLVDGSGPRGFLFRSLSLVEEPFEHLPTTSAVFAHFRGVKRWEDVGGVAPGAPPYPVDDAALHHVLDRGWAWVLRFAHGVTSAGVAMETEAADKFGFQNPERAWGAVLDAYPGLAAQFDGAEAVESFRFWPRLSFRASQAAGDDWALLPFAAGFVDPLLSTGFPLTLLGVLRLGDVLKQLRDGVDFTPALAAYDAATRRELAASEDLISALYAVMDDFEVFRRLSLLYFTAAVYSETVRRLGQPARARGFLLCDDPEFGPRMAGCCAQARTLRSRTGAERAALRSQLLDEIQRVIGPYDLAGLGRPDRSSRFPVDLADLYAARTKVGATSDDIDAMLRRCGAFPDQH